VTFLVQKLLGEMEKSGTEKTPGVTRFQKPAVTEVSLYSREAEHQIERILNSEISQKKI